MFSIVMNLIALAARYILLICLFGAGAEHRDFCVDIFAFNQDAMAKIAAKHNGDDYKVQITTG